MSWAVVLVPWEGLLPSSVIDRIPENIRSARLLSLAGYPLLVYISAAGNGPSCLGPIIETSSLRRVNPWLIEHIGVTIESRSLPLCLRRPPDYTNPSVPRATTRGGNFVHPDTYFVLHWRLVDRLRFISHQYGHGAQIPTTEMLPRDPSPFFSLLTFLSFQSLRWRSGFAYTLAYTSLEPIPRILASLMNLLRLSIYGRAAHREESRWQSYPARPRGLHIRICPAVFAPHHSTDLQLSSTTQPDPPSPTVLRARVRTGRAPILEYRSHDAGAVLHHVQEHHTFQKSIAASPRVVLDSLQMDYWARADVQALNTVHQASQDLYGLQSLNPQAGIEFWAFLQSLSRMVRLFGSLGAAPETSPVKWSELDGLPGTGGSARVLKLGLPADPAAEGGDALPHMAESIAHT
ncbi:hypothetical protein DFH09DRAFT_1278531 [Mycena vulgaris]|nr:hypothetical protein DFH09DRAFT_1278531 [Mycena vulgaris]